MEEKEQNRYCEDYSEQQMEEMQHDKNQEKKEESTNETKLFKRFQERSKVWKRRHSEKHNTFLRNVVAFVDKTLPEKYSKSPKMRGSLHTARNLLRQVDPILLRQLASITEYGNCSDESCALLQNFYLRDLVDKCMKHSMLFGELEAAGQEMISVLCPSDKWLVGVCLLKKCIEDELMRMLRMKDSLYKHARFFLEGFFGIFLEKRDVVKSFVQTRSLSRDIFTLYRCVGDCTSHLFWNRSIEVTALEVQDFCCRCRNFQDIREEQQAWHYAEAKKAGNYAKKRERKTKKKLTQR